MNKEKKEVDLGTGSVGKLLFRLALPAITAQIINVLYNIVDRIYIGHIEDIGPAALTGVGVALPVITAISAFASLMSIGGASRASIMLGKQDKKTAEKILGNCTGALLITGFLLTVLFLIFGRSILLMFGASENTIGYAWDYMRIYALGTISVQLSLGLNAFINAQGYAKTGMLTVLIGAISNIILDPILIFGFHMGVKGAAVATILSQTISAVWAFAFLLSKNTTLRIKAENMKTDFSIMGPCIALGASPFIMQFTESILSVCFNTSLAKYGGDTAVGVMTILGSVMQFSMLPLNGLTQGSQPIVSYNFGAGKNDRVRKSFHILLISCLTYSGLLWAMCMLFPQIFAMMFTPDAALISASQQYLRVYMAASGIFGAQIACQQTFIALGNAKSSLFLALLRKVILLIPFIYILPNFFSNQVFAVFLAEPVADLIAVTTTTTLFFRFYRKELPLSKKPEGSRS